MQLTKIQKNPSIQHSSLKPNHVYFT